MAHNESLRKAWNSVIHSTYGDIVITFFGGMVGAFMGLVIGWLLAQLFLAVLVLGLLLGIDPFFNGLAGLAWAICIAMAAIWLGTSMGCWYSLRDKYDGPILTAILSAATLGIAFYLVSIRGVVNSDIVAILFLAAAIPVGRVMYRILFAIRRV